MGLRSIFRHERSETAPTTRQRLNRDAISALFWVIFTALLGIIGLSLWVAALRYGVVGDGSPQEGVGSADEALSALGNLASAAVGGLVGWLARDANARYHDDGAAPGGDETAPAPDDEA